MYPFRIRIKDQKLERLLDILAKDRTVTVCSEKEYLRRLGYKLKPIRNDFFIGFDMKTKNSNISIKNPFVRIEKQGKDYIFKV